MDIIVEHVNVWAAPIKDQVGGLYRTLTSLKEAGADLDFVIARRTPEDPGNGVVFVTPLRGDREISAAANLGFNVSTSVSSVRVEGDNKPGLAADVTKILADAGITLRGFSAAVIGARFIFYIGFDSKQDAEKAVKLLQQE
ncbi:MAG TPA: ACT domain-containing protein [Planctomycetes bacterium]|nr:ACT domain-containing protein [Planctomycetota bacterium]HIJ71262.1 ACT domain-containing protein [Planctomycetota bacterium]